MSELKAYIAPTADGTGLADYYLKSEADKVIAEKDAEIEKLDDCIRDYSEKTKTLVIANLDMQRREDRQKYKRCLAMVEMCNARYDEEDAKVNGCGASWEYISKEMKFWERWHNRWLVIAEKFNEAK